MPTQVSPELLSGAAAVLELINILRRQLDLSLEGAAQKYLFKTFSGVLTGTSGANQELAASADNRAMNADDFTNSGSYPFLLYGFGVLVATGATPAGTATVKDIALALRDSSGYELMGQRGAKPPIATLVETTLSDDTAGVFKFDNPHEVIPGGFVVPVFQNLSANTRVVYFTLFGYQKLPIGQAVSQ